MVFVITTGSITVKMFDSGDWVLSQPRYCRVAARGWAKLPSNVAKEYQEGLENK